MFTTVNHQAILRHRQNWLEFEDRFLPSMVLSIDKTLKVVNPMMVVTKNSFRVWFQAIQRR